MLLYKLVTDKLTNHYFNTFPIEKEMLIPAYSCLLLHTEACGG